jgi:hypothetical protein
LNGNGVLDPNEVSTKMYVCNGTNPSPAWKAAQDAFEALAKTTVTLDWNSVLGSPSFVSFKAPFTVPDVTYDPAHPETTALHFLEISRAAWGAKPDDGFKIFTSTIDPAGPATVTFRQTYEDIPVDGARITVVLSSTGQVEFATGGFVPNLDLSITPVLSKEQASEAIIDAGKAIDGGANVPDLSQASLAVHVGPTPPRSATLAWRSPYTAKRKGAFDQSALGWTDATSGSLINDVPQPTLGLFFEELYSSVSPSNKVYDTNTPPPSNATDACKQDEFKVYDATMKFDSFISGFGYQSFTGHNDWYRNVVLCDNVTDHNSNFVPNHAFEDCLTATPTLVDVSIDHGPYAIFDNGISGLDQVSHEWGHGFATYTGLIGHSNYGQLVLQEGIADAIGALVVCAQSSGCTWQIHLGNGIDVRNLRNPNPWSSVPMSRNDCTKWYAENYDDFLNSKNICPDEKYHPSTAFSHAVYLFGCNRDGSECTGGIGPHKAAAILLNSISYHTLAPDGWSTLGAASLGLASTCDTLARAKTADNITDADCQDVRTAFRVLGYPLPASEAAATVTAPATAPGVPPAPSIFMAAYQPEYGLNTIFWNATANASDYLLYWGTSPGVTSSSNLLTPTNSTSYGHSGVQPGWTYYYRVAARNAAGLESPLSEEVSVTVPGSPGEAPDAGTGDANPDTGTSLPLAITSFGASPSTIAQGQNSTLSWVVVGAASVAIDQGVDVAAGTSAVVSPTQTTTYTLTISSGAGTTVTKQATVTVLHGIFTPTGNMVKTRSGHTATLLASGKVLIVGGSGDAGGPSAEIYDPSSGTFTSTGSLNIGRSAPTATLLSSGKVLIAGGASGNTQNSAELYDPIAGGFSRTGNMVYGYGTTATRLLNGQVLIVGGGRSTEIYDPSSETFSATGDLVTLRLSSHTATLLTDGRILIAGGMGDYSHNYGMIDSAELYDPNTGRFAATGTMGATRWSHSATLLPNGKVLIAGSAFSCSWGFCTNLTAASSAEIYDPGTARFTTTGNLAQPTYSHTATLLPNGKVLLAGGASTALNADAEIYDPDSGTFTTIGSMSTPRMSHTATLLPNGTVLISGGLYGGGSGPSAELYE